MVEYVPLYETAVEETGAEEETADEEMRVEVEDADEEVVEEES